LLILIPGLGLLVGNLGLFADAGHTLWLAFHLGLSGVMAQIVARSPAVLTLAVFAVLCCRPKPLLALFLSETLSPKPPAEQTVARSRERWFGSARTG
jgi:hypothetical protein